MTVLAAIVVVLALAGAVASWIAGAMFYRQALRAGAPSPRMLRYTWLRTAFWPFAAKQIPGAPADHAIRLNKALVAVFTCLTIAVAATSVATNLSRLSR